MVWSTGAGALEYEIAALETAPPTTSMVRAVNSIDPGPWSIPESKTPGDALGPPLNVIAKAQERALEISWGAPAGASGVITWEVRYIQSDAPDRADENWESEDRLTRSAPYRHTVDGLLSATNYDVQVRGFNANGAGQWSVVASGAPYDPPGRPELAPLVLESQAVTILWTRPDDDGGADITSYDLQYWQGELPDANTNWNLRSNIWRVARDSKTSFRLGRLRNGNRYWVRLRAQTPPARGLGQMRNPGFHERPRVRR